MSYNIICLFLIQKIYAVAGLDRTQAQLTPQTPKVADNGKAQLERKKKADQASKRRAKLMAKMATMQKSFIQQNEELFVTTPSELAADAADRTLCCSTMDVE